MLARIKKYQLALFLITMLIIIVYTRDGVVREWRLLGERVHFNCSITSASHQACIMAYYDNLTREQGAKSALGNVAISQIEYANVRILCHQITHTIGRATSGGGASLATLFADGDPLCGSGYYHGVVEGKLRHMESVDVTPSFINTFCANMREGQQYQFDYANCTHGIGHALMFISDNDLPMSLAHCRTLTHKEDEHNCVMGVFMENIIASASLVGHNTKYIKEDDMYFPCTIVTETEHIPICFVAQAAHIWKSADNPTLALSACKEIGNSAYEDACSSGLGRVIAEYSKYTVAETIALCSSGSSVNTPIDNNQFRACIMGAMEAFVVHYRDTTHALALCHALPTSVEAVCSNERIAEFRAYIGG